NALPALPIPDKLPSSALFPATAAVLAAINIYSADAARAVDPSWPLPGLEPNPATLRAPRPAPTPPSTLRPDDSAPASAHRDDPFSPGPRSSPAPATAQSLRTSLPAPSAASTARSPLALLHNKISDPPPAPISSPVSEPIPRDFQSHPAISPPLPARLPPPLSFPHGHPSPQTLSSSSTGSFPFVALYGCVLFTAGFSDPNHNPRSRTRAGRSIVTTNNSSHAKEDVGDSPFRSFPTARRGLLTSDGVIGRDSAP